MWSTVVMFVLTFAILGLLLGVAAIYDPSQNSEQPLTSDPTESTTNTTSTSGTQSNPAAGSG